MKGGFLLLKIINNQNYKYITSISQNIYIDKLVDISYRNNNTYHRIIKRRTTDVNSNKCIYFGVKNNDN